MLVPIKAWFDDAAKILPDGGDSCYKLQSLRCGVEELQKLGVGFQYLPEPKSKNLSHSLGVIRNVASDAFIEPGCANWVKQVHRRIRELQDALRAEGIV